MEQSGKWLPVDWVMKWDGGICKETDGSLLGNEKLGLKVICFLGTSVNGWELEESNERANEFEEQQIIEEVCIVYKSLAE